MTDFNPLIGPLITAAPVQDQAGRQKQQQGRRPPAKPKDVPEQHDRFEPQADGVNDSTERESKKQRNGSQKPSEEKSAEDSHIDLSA